MTLQPNSSQPNSNWESPENDTSGLTRVAIGVGSNLGDPHRNIVEGLTRLQRLSQVTVLAISPFYWTDPVYPDLPPIAPAPRYLNGAALLATHLTPAALMACLLEVEAQLGRVRRDRWESRPLDLDILLWEDRILSLPEVTVPHPRLHERAFVLVPLSQLVPHWPYPSHADGPLTIADLAIRVGSTGVAIDCPVTIDRPVPVDRLARELPSAEQISQSH
jgi:2-amino-4-hydroxy-6-hydroxymethyldihydropteridine diphosphokinase